ncbi:replication protein, partial [Bacillus cereus]|nr:replication protein [Bacillus cereus]
MSKLLIHEEPLIVLPGLAKMIGLNEAIFLQQVHYWINKSKNFNDGYYWVYNSYDEWLKQFPFWSSATLRRIINKLEKQGLLIKGNYNKLKIDQTKWYRIDYDLLERMSRPSAQNEQM